MRTAFRSAGYGDQEHELLPDWLLRLGRGNVSLFIYPALPQRIFLNIVVLLYTDTPFVIMSRKSSLEKSDNRNTSSGDIPSCLSISGTVLPWLIVTTN